MSSEDKKDVPKNDKALNDLLDGELEAVSLGSPA